MRAVPTPASPLSTVHTSTVHSLQSTVHQLSTSGDEQARQRGSRSKGRGGGALENIGIRQATGDVPRSSRAVLVVQEAATRQ